MKEKFILFDFDGVIADSFQVAFEVQKKICHHLTEDGYRKRFEGNINDWKDGNRDCDENCRHDLDFFEEYVPRMKGEVSVIPGMREIISELAREYNLVIISSTISSPIGEFLKKHDLDDHFSWIMGNDVHKSKIEKIRMVFDKYRTVPDDCVFITDTLGDAHEAEKAGIGSIGVLWGFHPLETLSRGEFFRIVEKPEGIPIAIGDYFIHRA